MITIKNKKHAEAIIEMRKDEGMYIDGLFRIHKDSWTELLLARIYLELHK